MPSASRELKNIQKRIGLIWEDKVEDVEKEWLDGKLKVVELKKRAIAAGELPHRLFEGDNLPILKQLVAEGEQFEVIYIDPPYNTGNRDFKYNDRYVDADDEYRHSKWMSFMYKRLWETKQLLSDKGAIFISIDDYEHARLKLLCDGIFGAPNFVANFVRKCKGGSGHDSKQVAVEFDYLLCYAKNMDQLEFTKAEVNVKTDPKYRYADEQVKRRGKYYLRELNYKGNYSPTLDYEIEAPDGSKIYAGGKKGKPNTWRWSRGKFEWGVENDFIVFKKNRGGWKVYIKQYVDNKDKRRIRKLPRRALIDFSNAKGSNELKAILNQDIFTYPKPTELIRYILQLFHDKELSVLDFFAGSGSTMHATLLQNEADGGKRRCTLITNNENRICEEVTYPRLAGVITGYTTPQGKQVEGLTENSLRYFQLQKDG